MCFFTSFLRNVSRILIAVDGSVHHRAESRRAVTLTRDGAVTNRGWNSRCRASNSEGANDSVTYVQRYRIRLSEIPYADVYPMKRSPSHCRAQFVHAPTLMLRYIAQRMIYAAWIHNVTNASNVPHSSFIYSASYRCAAVAIREAFNAQPDWNLLSFTSCFERW